MSVILASSLQSAPSVSCYVTQPTRVLWDEPGEGFRACKCLRRGPECAPVVVCGPAPLTHTALHTHIPDPTFACLAAFVYTSLHPVLLPLPPSPCLPWPAAWRPGAQAGRAAAAGGGAVVFLLPPHSHGAGGVWRGRRQAAGWCMGMNRAGKVGEHLRGTCVRVVGWVCLHERPFISPVRVYFFALNGRMSDERVTSMCLKPCNPAFSSMLPLPGPFGSLLDLSF